MTDIIEKAGYSVNEWAVDVGIGRTKTYELIKEKMISTKKIGTRRIITTPPKQYLERTAGTND